MRSRVGYAIHAESVPCTVSGAVPRSNIFIIIGYGFTNERVKKRTLKLSGNFIFEPNFLVLVYQVWKKFEAEHRKNTLNYDRAKFGVKVRLPSW